MGIPGGKYQGQGYQSKKETPDIRIITGNPFNVSVDYNYRLWYTEVSNKKGYHMQPIHIAVQYISSTYYLGTQNGLNWVIYPSEVN